MKAEELAVIKERSDKAKEGPWVFDGDITYRKNGMLEPIVFSLYGGFIYMDEEDGEFIAHAREDVPKLVAEVERYQKFIETLKNAYWNGTDYELEQMIIRGMEDE